MKKVMLIKPSNTIPNDSLKRLITPLSLLYIAAVLRENDYKVKILDSTCEGYNIEYRKEKTITYGLMDKQIIERIQQYKPDIVGITSMFSSQQEHALRYCDLTKEADPSIPVVIGGLHSSLFPKETIEHRSIDYVIMEEGEYRFLHLLNDLNDGKTDFTFDGIAYKKNNKIIINSPTQKIDDLNALPLPARDLIDMERYINICTPIGPFPRKERVEQIMTSRGCPFSCRFCSASNYFGHKFRARSVDNIMEEIDLLKSKYHIQEIQFTDDNLTADKKRANELFKRLKEYNLSWCTPNGIMIKTLDKEMISLMAESGAYQLTFAVESGNERVLKDLIHKKVPSKEEVQKLTKFSQDKNIQVHATFIVGFPGETKDEINETLQYPFDVKFNSVSYFILTPIPGSELYEECKSKGYLSSIGSRLNVKTAEIHIPQNSSDFVMSTTDLEKLVDDKTREYNEFAKKQFPDDYEIKFRQFLKKHNNEYDLVSGRVT